MVEIVFWAIPLDFVCVHWVGRATDAIMRPCIVIPIHVVLMEIVLSRQIPMCVIAKKVGQDNSATSISTIVCQINVSTVVFVSIKSMIMIVYVNLDGADVIAKY